MLPTRVSCCFENVRLPALRRVSGPSVIEHGTLFMRTRRAWIAVQIAGGAAVLAAGLAMSDATSAIGVFWMAWALSALADRIRVENMVLHRRSIFGAAPGVDLAALTHVDLSRRSTVTRFPSLRLVLNAEGSRELRITLWKWTNSKELLRLVAQTTLAAAEDVGQGSTIEMSERTRRRLGGHITS